MAVILRGDVRWTTLPGHRQVLVLSHDIFNARSGTVIAVAVTTRPQRAGFPLTLPLEIPDMRSPAWAKISQIRTIPAARIGRRQVRVPPVIVARVIEGLEEILGE